MPQCHSCTRALYKNFIWMKQQQQSVISVPSLLLSHFVTILVSDLIIGRELGCQEVGIIINFRWFYRLLPFIDIYIIFAYPDLIWFSFLFYVAQRHTESGIHTENHKMQKILLTILISKIFAHIILICCHSCYAINILE